MAEGHDAARVAGKPRAVDMLIVGGGFSGMIMAIDARKRGFGDLLILEKAETFGGTWRENTYPGVACDVPAHLYSIASSPNPGWSRVYAKGPEIQSYILDVARREGLEGVTRFGAKATGADWDAVARRWRVTTEGGETFVCRVLVSATGPLHVPRLPSVPGIDAFEGPAFHSAEWDRSVDLTGKRVAIVGTGASAIQFVPEVVRKAARVTLYQRTPPWVAPRLDGPIPEWRRKAYASVPGLRALRRWISYRYHEMQHRVFRGAPRAVRFAQKMALMNLRSAIKDRKLRAKLTPNYRIGCKRILFSNTYYKALARETVEVVTRPVTAVTAGGLVAADGVERPADVLIFATGFQVADGAGMLPARGRGGQTLSEAWRDGMSAYLGTAMPGFPNLFFLLGPNTGLGHNSVLLMVEQQVEHVLRLLSEMREAGFDVTVPR